MHWVGRWDVYCAGVSRALLGRHYQKHSRGRKRLRSLRELLGFPGISPIPSPSCRSAHVPPGRDAGGVWTAWPGRDLVGAQAPFLKRHLGAVMTGKPGTLAGLPD